MMWVGGVSRCEWVGSAVWLDVVRLVFVESAEVGGCGPLVWVESYNVGGVF